MTDTAKQKTTIPTAFLLGIAGVALLLLGMCLLVASRESFIRDDFAFLSYVQRPHWSWFEIYFPIEQRWWWAYRPLGMETFFFVGHRLFGLEAFGYYAIAIALHFATGLLAYRLMLRLDFDPRIAATGAMLSLSRHPAMRDIFYGSVFHYTAAIFFSLLAMLQFIDFVRLGAIRRQALSCGFLTLALLCNEFPVVLPVFFGILSLHLDGTLGRRLSIDTLKSASMRALPQLIIAGLYLVWRFRIIAPVQANAAYALNFDPWWILRQFAEQLVLLFEAPSGLAIALGILAAIWIAIAIRSEGRQIARSWLLPLYLLCGAWIVGLLLPFSILSVAHARFSKPIEIPACIVFAGALEVLWRVYAPRHQRALEVGLIVLLLATLPYASLARRYESPVGGHGLHLAEAIRAGHPVRSPGSRVVVLYNAPGLASHAGGAKFKREIFGGNAALQAYFPDEYLKFELHDLWKQHVEPGCRNCLYLQLMPDLGVEAASTEMQRFRAPFPTSS